MIKFTHVNKSYEENVIDDATFELPRGSFSYVTGESGVGKSTLIKMILGEVKPDSGQVIVNGNEVEKMTAGDIANYRRRMGIIFQDFRLIQDLNVFENVALPLKIYGAPKSTIQKEVTYTLSLLGISKLYDRYPKEISGGEQQKVCLARAIVNHPYVLLADEPTANLDPESSREVERLLEIINQMGTTVVVATHNYEIMNPEYQELKMNQGKINIIKGICKNAE